MEWIGRHLPVSFQPSEDFMEAIVGGTVAFQGAKLRWISERDEEGVELCRISGKDRR